VTDIVQTVSSHLSRVSLKMTKAKFESMTSHDQNFEIMVNELVPEIECNKESAVAAMNYVMLKHGVPISSYHVLTKRFKELPCTYKVS